MEDENKLGFGGSEETEPKPKAKPKSRRRAKPKSTLEDRMNDFQFEVMTPEPKPEVVEEPKPEPIRVPKPWENVRPRTKGPDKPPKGIRSRD